VPHGNNVTAEQAIHVPTALLLNSARPPSWRSVGRGRSIHGPTTRAPSPQPAPRDNGGDSQPSQASLEELDPPSSYHPHPETPVAYFASESFVSSVAPAVHGPEGPSTNHPARPAAACLRIGYVRRRRLTTTYDVRRPCPRPCNPSCERMHTYIHDDDDNDAVCDQGSICSTIAVSDRIGSDRKRFSNGTHTQKRSTSRWETNKPILSPRRSRRGLLVRSPPAATSAGWACLPMCGCVQRTTSQGVSHETLSLSMNDVDMTHKKALF
jgi:hypothetical protein